MPSSPKESKVLHLRFLSGTKLYEKRACNFHSDCTVSKILIVAKNSSPTLYQIKNRIKSLEDFDHMLNMVGHGWVWYTTPQN